MLLLAYVLRPRDYKIYEVSGLLASALLLPFLSWEKTTLVNPKFLAWYVALVGFIWLKILDPDDVQVEVSPAKLRLRSAIVGGCGLILVAHYFFHLFEDGMAIFVWFLLGYVSFSSLYQFHMLRQQPPPPQSLLGS